MMAWPYKLENASSFGPVLIEPEAGCCASADQRAVNCALLAFGHSADTCTGASADTDDGRSAARTRHPAMAIIIIDNARTVEKRDPAVAYLKAIFVAPDNAAEPFLP